MCGKRNLHLHLPFHLHLEVSLVAWPKDIEEKTSGGEVHKVVVRLEEIARFLLLPTLVSG